MRKSPLKKKKVKPKRDRLRILHDKAWDLWSIYIRKRDNGICFTCNDRQWDEELGENSIKGMQAGHLHHNVLDFDEKNIHCQCSRCNHYLSGNLQKYSARFIDKYGLDEFTALEIRASMALKGEKRSEEDYRKLIEELNKKLQ